MPPIPPVLPVQGELVLAHVLRHFTYADRANAAVHCAPVRYSPITFDVARMLASQFDLRLVADADVLLIGEVLGDVGRYELDLGR